MAHRFATRTALSAAFALVAVFLTGDHPAEVAAATPPPLSAPGGVVAADHPLASRVGAQVLARGGNAVDAAAATALALGVVNPMSSGIGGGGFAVIYVAAEKKTVVVDFRETGPAAITPALYRKNGKLDVELARRGGLAVGIPGEVAGLSAMVERFGTLAFRDVVAPACHLAEAGFATGWYLDHVAALVASRLPAASRLLAWLAPGGDPLHLGERVTRPRLANTLRAIAAHGRDGFYRGPVAADMVAAVKATGGVMTAVDLAGYQAVWREPLTGTFGDYTVAAMPLPSSGGIAILEALGILDATGIDLAKLGAGSSAAYQVIAEILKHAFADRARLLGDTGAAERMEKQLLAKKRLARLARRVSLRHVLRHSRYGSADLGKATAVPRDGGTSHLCVIDKDGNAVALTTTINGYFGAQIMARQSGVILNNEMDDFALAPNTPNQFGLVQSEANLVGPGKRPLSSMSPTLVFKGGKVVGCFGGSGGPTIISNTLQVMLDVLVFGMDVREAVSFPRIHHQWLPDKLFVEPEVAADVRAGLSRRGQKVEVADHVTAVQAIVVGPDGTRYAASDPRKAGRPAAARPRARATP
ncbi:MAG TPA: gamma-glutamyltransferase [Kofleriaceae bacterium]|nr:gamma-glutamyltransferase [Kofleriaceae bacterium]